LLVLVQRNSLFPQTTNLCEERIRLCWHIKYNGHIYTPIANASSLKCFVLCM